MQPPLANVFQPLINVFEAILKVFHDDIGLGWGLAIIALTLLIRSLLLPLTLKQLRSMHRITQFTPEIKKLREKHGSDRPPAGAAPTQEEALGSTPVSRRDLRQPDRRPFVRQAGGRHPQPATGPKLCARCQSARLGFRVPGRR
jgi:hypothetical protein